MKYTGSKSLSSFLRFSLETIFYLMIIFELYHFFMILTGHAELRPPEILRGHGPFKDSKFIPISIVEIMLMASFRYIGIFLIFFLKKVFRNFSKNMIFIKENFDLIKKMGILVMILSIVHGLVKFIFWNKFKFELFLDKPLKGIIGLIRPELFFLGLMVIVLSEIFNNAVKIKEENDLTI